MNSLLGPTAKPDDPPSLQVHTLEEQEGQEPMPEIVDHERHVQAIPIPRLLVGFFESSVENKGADGRDGARLDLRIYHGSNLAHAVEPRQV